ncbi:MAG: arginase family protein [Xenococcaceae cyanobacterium]
MQEIKRQQVANNWQKQISRNWETKPKEHKSSSNYSHADNVNIDVISSLLKIDLTHRSQPKTFLKTPLIKELSQLKEYDVAVLGIPYTSWSSRKSKINFGPQGIRRVSASYQSSYEEINAKLQQKISLCDVGNINFFIEEEEKSFNRISQEVASVVDTGIFPIFLGGDRSISSPIIKGISSSLSEQKIGVIHFDRSAWLDSRDRSSNSNEQKYNNCFLNHQLTNVSSKNIVQIGVSDPTGSEKTFSSTLKTDNHILTVREIAKIGFDAAVDFALKRALDNTDRVYISFDISCIDSEYSESGCLLPREAIYLLSKIVKGANICGLGVVGVSPPNEIGNIEAMMATRIICNAIANLADSEQLPKR